MNRWTSLAELSLINIDTTPLVQSESSGHLLQTLTLNGCTVADWLLIALKHSTNLAELNVGNNNLDEAKARILAGSLVDCRSLKKVNISVISIPRHGIVNILDSLKLQQVKELRLELPLYVQKITMAILNGFKDF